ncbi:kinesin A-like protein [Encephalitozoon intestinalis ATCC 50506]|uniref:Kinesin-like protein n=1 Tax=Encephalitozoon intestinalis (strain ATCC 50506) TaxID=876142 RepID=E0S9G9_ENCIT|nr:kinesin A-like protein [Encephalitozoon intestinalis ATCC 50506]ADM12354.1 kinesin A-like protein [Encephalitozoon intestinalis ATCC 50506]UTX46184.1 kinesin motor protein [Encephalitozoon intestinalis]
MVTPGIRHRIDEIKEMFSEIKENINATIPNRVRKDSVLLEICTPGTCGYNGCSKSTRNRESELLERIKELELIIENISKVTDFSTYKEELQAKDIAIAMEEKNHEVKKMKEELSRIVSANECLRKDNLRIQSCLDEYKERASKLEETKKECLAYKEVISKLKSEIMDLKGSVQVICRIRPNTAGRKGSRIEISDGALKISMGGKEHSFSFDKVLGPHTTQECVYGEMEMILRSVLEGYRVCVFTYGQTGSGKTYTMEGNDNNPGLIVRTLKDIYSIIEEMRTDGWVFDITCSYVEIYNEDVVDLFSEDMRKVGIVHRGGDVNMVDCISISVSNASEAIGLFQSGARRKKIGDTNCNMKSSRSHVIFILKIKMSNKTSKEEKEGVMALIDLAGSERLSVSKAEGARLKETQNINKSLSALGDVFNSILRKDGHIPFRNSKLTHLLQSFLSGNSRAIMLVNISPDAEHFNETVCSLRFADRVSQCKLGSVKRKITNFVSE